MVYTSKELVSYSAVLDHIDKVKSKYGQYGISFGYEILTDGNTYKVVATEEQLEQTN